MDKTLIEISLRRARELYDLGILADIESPLCQSAITETLIRLDDCLQWLSKKQRRITFTNDVASGDITDLINTVRNAACHIQSGNHRINTMAFVFNIATGPNAYSINGTTLGSDYPDDIAYFYGTNRFYLRRHIGRSITEISEQLQLAA